MKINIGSIRQCFIIALTTATLFTVSCKTAQADDSKKEVKTTVKQLTESDAGTTVTIAVGASFDITLKANPTTGYGWKVEKIDSSAIAQKGEGEHVTNPHPAGMVGVGGMTTFHFEVKKSAKTVVELGYSRPWEKGVKPIQTFTVTIDAQK